MKTNTMWDFPHLPKELDKDKPLDIRLESDVAKRTWLLKIVRHRIKEILNNLTK